MTNRSLVKQVVLLRLRLIRCERRKRDMEAACKVLRNLALERQGIQK